MPVTLKSRPIENWDGINSLIPYSIEAFNAAKDPYHVASYKNTPFPYPYIAEDAPRAFVEVLSSVALQQRISNILGNHPIKVYSIRARALARVGQPDVKQYILHFVVTSERNDAAWKEAANFFQDLFERESHKKGTYTPFVVELTSKFAWYEGDIWNFMPPIHKGTKAIRAIKWVIKEVVAKCIPQDLRKDIIYREIIRDEKPDDSGFDREATVIVIVKHNSALRWHVVEGQIRDVVNKAALGPDVTIRLEFATGEKPKSSILEKTVILTPDVAV